MWNEEFLRAQAQELPRCKPCAVRLPLVALTAPGTLIALKVHRSVICSNSKPQLEGCSYQTQYSRNCSFTRHAWQCRQWKCSYQGLLSLCLSSTVESITTCLPHAALRKSRSLADHEPPEHSDLDMRPHLRRLAVAQSTATAPSLPFSPVIFFISLVKG